MITPDHVRHWARLARLELPDAELERLQGDLDKILEFVRALQDVPVETGTGGGEHPLPSVERPDEVTPSLSRAEAFGEARSTDDGHFAVPAVVESEAQYERRTGSADGDPNVNASVDSAVDPNVNANVDANVDSAVDANVDPNVDPNVDSNVDSVLPKDSDRRAPGSFGDSKP